MIKRIAFVLLLTFSASAFAANTSAPDCADVNQTAQILNTLSKSVNSLQSLSAKVSYSHSQPIFETESIRTGNIFYQYDANTPRLRIDFKILIQDGQKQKGYREDFLFDGVWLTRIDNQSKTITKQQLTEPENPLAPFDLVSRFFPIVGFTAPEKLKSHFEVKFFPSVASKALLRFRLLPKVGSPYSRDYRSVEFIVPKKMLMPVEFTAETVSGELIKIVFSNIKKNKKLSASAFKQPTAKNFTESINPLR
ncbi:MAG: hypothetical protein K8R02_07905 [Anaerohalosphaeraceae bacterium]|nr:hypothetical protein [Anaerohalosphaeraceae bacterium]